MDVSGMGPRSVMNSIDSSMESGWDSMNEMVSLGDTTINLHILLGKV